MRWFRRKRTAHPDPEVCLDLCLIHRMNRVFECIGGTSCYPGLYRNHAWAMLLAAEKALQIGGEPAGACRKNCWMHCREPDTGGTDAEQ